ncbi:hypothetical protein ABC347_16965 [Sphingomonas sp. 1P06PA]|uniref:hypothetical protein n=1 Tax=Sphingomonas sp. 1P06PA TaxID=554121 RepID=UPI0039A64740
MSTTGFAPLTPQMIRRPRAAAEEVPAELAGMVRAIRSRPGLAADARFFLTTYAAGLVFFLALIA